MADSAPPTVWQRLRPSLVLGAVFVALLAVGLAPLLAALWPAVSGALLPLHLLLLGAYGSLVMLLFGAPLLWAARFDRAEAGWAERDRDRPEWAPMPPPVPPGAPRRVVLLIHGTFANNAPWTHPAAPLPQALSAGATVLPFLWSDVNSMRARRIAVERLRRHVQRLAEAGCGPIALVGHSHAGNIALKACEDPATAARVQALVCLSTPFISAWRPPLAPRTGLAAQLGLCVLASGLGLALVMATGAVIGDPRVPPGPRETAALAASGLIALLLGLAGVRIALSFRLDRGGPVAEAADADVAGSVCEAAALAPLRGRTLILTRSGDEADGVLKLASLLNRQMVGLAQRLAKGDFGSSAALLDASVRGSLQGGLALLAAVSSLAFGANGLRHPTGTYFTSSETPPGTWMHLALGGESALGELYHSSLYEDPQAIAAVAGWIDAQAPLPAP